jgi:hypothetical protein
MSWIDAKRNAAGGWAGIRTPGCDKTPSAISRSRLLELAAPAIGFKIAFAVIVRGRPTLRVVEVPICISRSDP